ncbi:stage V sporulation protein AA [Defluviitalea phaphyphila]|uniref:stage V sporulation protein AA n=1 Tax=Defluviitalea phaphyphila TaxID=1473580 RepID=UPI00072FBD22|nr:stage V sporulation protein AA [Defluviitalea phaphyphila]
MIIYIKLYKKTTIYNKRKIKIKDIAEIAGCNKIKNVIENMTLLEINDNKKKNFVISIIDVIKTIYNVYPEIIIENVGEKDSIIEYYPNEKKNENPIITFLKVFSVCCILFAGGGIAIITFHTDAGLPDALKQLYKILTGIETDKPYWIQIPYSIGIAVGIIVFFNHFSSKKITDDPTPIEVEMDLYENDVENCIMDNIIDEKRRKK